MNYKKHIAAATIWLWIAIISPQKDAIANQDEIKSQTLDNKLRSINEEVSRLVQKNFDLYFQNPERSTPYPEVETMTAEITSKYSKLLAENHCSGKVLKNLLDSWLSWSEKLFRLWYEEAKKCENENNENNTSYAIYSMCELLTWILSQSNYSKTRNVDNFAIGIMKNDIENYLNEQYIMAKITDMDSEAIERALDNLHWTDFIYK